ncbi:MAG: CopG family transcriptional regulator [Alteromonadaceae bacterium]|nr:CopG family transcriptional regulator [Alteromonadaceae bacterium]|tara:strand:+ start:1060 stop:1305 length:246 start_codon:yes stop_codon:yes gene_type:complete
MKAKNFEDKFDNGDEILQHLDLSKAKRPMQKQRRINVDIPEWMIDSLDREASRVGVTRQSIIKVWLAERLEQSQSLDRTGS